MMSEQQFTIESERINTTYSVRILKDDEVIFEISNWDSLGGMHKTECENIVALLNELYEERNYFERKKCEYWNKFNLVHLDNINLRKENEQLRQFINKGRRLSVKELMDNINENELLKKKIRGLEKENEQLKEEIRAYPINEEYAKEIMQQNQKLRIERNDLRRENEQLKKKRIDLRL